VHTYPFADLALARRLERAEATSNARFVELRGGIDPGRGACWIEVGGTYAMYDGPSSPVTQTFGLGMFQAPTADDFDRLERFFFERGAPADHEVSPQTDPTTLALLTERGYRPIEFTSVMYLPVPSAYPTNVGLDPRLRTRVIQSGEEDAWASVSARGWGEYPELREFLLGMGQVIASSQGALVFLAEWDDIPIGTAVLWCHDGVALLGGASTVPEARRRGAQRALLAARLAHAADAGCDLAMMCAQPGSASQRNAERQGFRIAYTRTKWRLETSMPGGQRSVHDGGRSSR